MAKFFESLSREELDNVLEKGTETSSQTSDIETVTENIVSNNNKTQNILNTVEDGIEEMENLENKDKELAVLEQAESTGPSMESYKLAMVSAAHEALNTVSRRLGLTVALHNIGHESFDSSKELSLAREGIGDALKKIKNAVMIALNKIWEFICKVTNSILEFLHLKKKNIEDKDKENKEKIKETRKEVNESNLDAKEKDTVNKVLDAAEGKKNLEKSDLENISNITADKKGDSEDKESTTKKPLSDQMFDILDGMNKRLDETKENDKLISDASLRTLLENNIWICVGDKFQKNSRNTVERITKSLLKIAPLINYDACDNTKMMANDMLATLQKTEGLFNKITKIVDEVRATYDAAGPKGVMSGPDAAEKVISKFNISIKEYNDLVTEAVNSIGLFHSYDKKSDLESKLKSYKYLPIFKFAYTIRMIPINNNLDQEGDELNKGSDYKIITDDPSSISKVNRMLAIKLLPYPGAGPEIKKLDAIFNKLKNDFDKTRSSFSENTTVTGTIASKLNAYGGKDEWDTYNKSTRQQALMLKSISILASDLINSSYSAVSGMVELEMVRLNGADALIKLAKTALKK